MSGTIQCGMSPGYYYTGKHPALAFDAAVPFGLNSRQQIAWLRAGHEDWEQVQADDELKEERDQIAVFARATEKAREQAEARNQRGPSAAEFLDLVLTWRQFGEGLQGQALVNAMRTVFDKSAQLTLDLDDALKQAHAEGSTS